MVGRSQHFLVLSIERSLSLVVLVGRNPLLVGRNPLLVGRNPLLV